MNQWMNLEKEWKVIKKRVINPKALPRFIENEPDIISREDMMLASFHISLYIRTKEAQT